MSGAGGYGIITDEAGPAIAQAAVIAGSEGHELPIALWPADHTRAHSAGQR